MPVWDKAAFDQFYTWRAEKYGHPGGPVERSEIKLHYHYWSVGQGLRFRFAPLLFGTLGLNSGDSIILLGTGFNWTGEGLADLGVDVTGTDISAYILAEKNNTEEAEIRQLCLDVGVDPDVDKIYCLPTDPGAALTLDATRIAATVNWLTDPREAESRASWIAKHGPVPSVADVSAVPNEHLGNWQWMRDPLDLYLRGGRANPQPRGYGRILGEDMASRKSRNGIHKTLNNSARYVISEEVLNGMSDAEGLVVCENMAKMASEHKSSVIHTLSPLQGPGAPEMNWKSYADWRTHLTANGFADQMIVPTITYSGVTAYCGLI